MTHPSKADLKSAIANHYQAMGRDSNHTAELEDATSPITNFKAPVFQPLTPPTLLDHNNFVVVPGKKDHKHSSIDFSSKSRSSSTLQPADCCVVQQFQGLRYFEDTQIDAGEIDPVLRLMCWIDFWRDSGCDRDTKRKCPLQHCTFSCTKNEGSLLSHIFRCPFLKNGAYICPYHKRVEVFVGQEEIKTHRKRYRKSTFRNTLREFYHRIKRFLGDSDTQSEWSSSESGESSGSALASLTCSPTSPTTTSPWLDVGPYQIGDKTPSRLTEYLDVPQERQEPYESYATHKDSDHELYEFDADVPSELPNEIIAAYEVPGQRQSHGPDQRQSNVKLQLNTQSISSPADEASQFSPLSPGYISTSPISPQREHAQEDEHPSEDIMLWTEDHPGTGASLNAILSNDLGFRHESRASTVRLGSKSPLMRARGVEIACLNTDISSGSKTATGDGSVNVYKSLPDVPIGSLNSTTGFLHPTAGSSTTPFSAQYGGQHSYTGSLHSASPASASSNRSSLFDRRSAVSGSPATATDPSPQTPFPTSRAALLATVEAEAEPEPSHQNFPLRLSKDYVASELSYMNDVVMDQFMTDYQDTGYRHETISPQVLVRPASHEYNHTGHGDNDNMDLDHTQNQAFNHNQQQDHYPQFNSKYNDFPTPVSGNKHFDYTDVPSGYNYPNTRGFANNQLELTFAGYSQQQQAWQEPATRYSSTRAFIAENSTFFETNSRQEQIYTPTYHDTKPEQIPWPQRLPQPLPQLLPTPSPQTSDLPSPTSPQIEAQPEPEPDTDTIPNSTTDTEPRGTLKCNECSHICRGKIKFLRSNLQRHKRECHLATPRTIKCRHGTCGRLFKRKHNLDQHVRTVHAGSR